jgi:hypothetical protein
MMKNTKFLFVTCCLEESRAKVLKEVVENLSELKDIYGDNLTVFDNGSTVDWVVPMLKENFDNVVVASKNVGYWSAIHWWLNNVEQDEFTYIIESDMMHYAMWKLAGAIDYLQKNPEMGSVRCHDYEVANWKLYDKNRPQANSKRNIWQSHTNKVTGKPIIHELKAQDPDIFETNFLTQLPALNRTTALKACFNELTTLDGFTEFDFQKMYWNQYPCTGIIDGGIFHCDAASWGQPVITGSWTDPKKLKQIGYQSTRVASIADLNDYSVTCTKS